MNPYIGNNPYTMQSADIGYPNVQYQPSQQDTSMQDMFHNQALQQMQQLGTPVMPQQANLGGQIALAKALREFGNQGQDRLATSGYGTQSGALANPSTWTFGADAAQNYNFGG